MIRTIGLLLVALACAPTMADDLAGRVVDADGHAVAGARIDISTAGPKVGRGMFCPSCYLDCKKFAKSDGDGNFVINDLDPTLKFHLLATASNKATSHTDWIDPSQQKVVITLENEREVDEAHLLIGKVIDAQGIAVAGALVSPCGAKNAKMQWGGRIDGAIEVVTDDQGRFRMPLDDDFVFLEVQVTGSGTPGIISSQLAPGAVEHEITVPSGSSVRGKLTHNGHPKANQPIAVVQLDRSGSSHFIKAVLATSDLDGNFEFDYLPAAQPYVIFTPRGVPSTGYCIRTTMFNVDGNGSTKDIGALELTTGYRLEGKLVSTSSKQLPTDMQLAINRDPAWDLIDVPVEPDGRFKIDNLPMEAYQISFNSKDWVLDQSNSDYMVTGPKSIAWGLTEDREGLLVPLRERRADETYLTPKGYWPDQVKEPAPGSQSISGIIIDESGNPIDAMELWVATAEYNHKYNGPRAKTLSDGKFSFDNLPDELVVIHVSNPNSKRYSTGRHAHSYEPHVAIYPSLNQKDIQIIYDRHTVIEMPSLEKSPPVIKKLVKPLK